MNENEESIDVNEKLTFQEQIDREILNELVEKATQTEDNMSIIKKERIVRNTTTSPIRKKKYAKLNKRVIKGRDKKYY